MGELALPHPVSAVTFSFPSDYLAVATDDGSVRLYQKPYTKVWKAVKSLCSEVSSVAFSDSEDQSATVTLLSLWIACGQYVLHFEFTSESLILKREDAIFDICLTEEDDDVVNQIAVNKTHLAYTLDSGAVGTINLHTKERTVMKTRHSSLCMNVSFIPHRPRELVSAGYDFNIFHYDFHLGTLLSSFKVDSSTEPSSQIALSPPFIQCLSISSNDVIACGLADGRIWVGFGGDKALTHRKKRRKWDGLRQDSAAYYQAADGPVVGIAFVDSNQLVTMSLLGVLTLFEVSEGKLATRFPSYALKGISKTNGLAINGLNVWVGGITSEGKGIVISTPIDILQGSTKIEAE